MSLVPEWEKDSISEACLAHPEITIQDNENIATIYLCDIKRGEGPTQYSAVSQIDDLIAELKTLREQCVAFEKAKE